MTKASEMLALAERCEAATGPDRELDCAIADLLLPPARRVVTRPDGGALAGPYTASLDAAMTLYLRVPERVPANPRKAAAEALRQRAEEFCNG